VVAGPQNLVGAEQDKYRRKKSIARSEKGRRLALAEEEIIRVPITFHQQKKVGPS
jgi:hypothetical protein